jgi:hypothetical protein
LDFVFSGRDAKKSSFGEVFMDVTAQKCHMAPDCGDFIYFEQVEKRDNKNLSGKLFNLLIKSQTDHWKKRKIEIIFRRESTQIFNY